MPYPWSKCATGGNGSAGAANFRWNDVCVCCLPLHLLILPISAAEGQKPAQQHDCQPCCQSQSDGQGTYPHPFSPSELSKHMTKALLISIVAQCLLWDVMCYWVPRFCNFGTFVSVVEFSSLFFWMHTWYFVCTFLSIRHHIRLTLHRLFCHSAFWLLATSLVFYLLASFRFCSSR